MICRNQKAIPDLQLMAPLPAGRAHLAEVPLNIAG